MNPPKPIVLLILDGFGCSESKTSNAITHAHMPVWNRLLEEYPHTQIDCVGSVVGLPEDQMGNSEVGHLHMGTGRLVAQDFTRINNAIENGAFFSNPVLCQAVADAKKNAKAVHILGLLSPGGVHCHEVHIAAMLELALEQRVEHVFLHAFLDGRDTPPRSAAKSLEFIEQTFDKHGNGCIASIIGRFYAMDRDKRWKRIRQAYEVIVQGKADYVAESAANALDMAYERGESDEFVKATVIVPAGQRPVAINDGDSVVFMNFRADRVRQLCCAMTQEDFFDFEREYLPRYGSFVTLNQYRKDFAFPVAFPPFRITNSLGELVSKLGLTQLRLSETEKYAHVTYFFNGGIEKPFAGETRILVPSPRVKTYDLQPEMSAEELTDKLAVAIESLVYDVIVCNYANCDMVGHTGDFAAAVFAAQAVDKALGRIVESIDKAGGILLITADHGNIEQMVDPKTGQAHTAHTMNPVPLLCLGHDYKLDSGGNLADIAPTILEILGIEKPIEMTGRSLLLHN